MSDIQAEHPFSDLGIDVETGTVLFDALKVGPVEFGNPMSMAKLRDVAQFLSDSPDPTFLVNSLIRGNKNPNMSNLDYLASYVLLQKQKSEAEDRVNKINKELKHYE